MSTLSDKSSDWTTDSIKCLLIVCNSLILSISGVLGFKHPQFLPWHKPPRSTNHRSVLVAICLTSTFSWFPKAAGNTMCRQWLNLTGLHERDPAAEMKRISEVTGEERGVLDERQRAGSLSQYLKGSLHLNITFCHLEVRRSWQAEGSAVGFCVMKSSQVSVSAVVIARRSILFSERIWIQTELVYINSQKRQAKTYKGLVSSKTRT